MTDFSTILIANRGEIAVRVIRSARALGYRTVAVYSEADREAPHVRAADRAVCIGPPQVGMSYLDIERVLDAARRTGADAVHPGYGFLSENADFAAACNDAGVAFIGPPPEAIRLMGNKAAAKRRMLDAGVPCVPGYEGEAQDDARLREEADAIGYPVMIKAAAGGGGRGMRRVDEAGSFDGALRSARSEALNAFGSDELILEKAVVSPRHVEIQVFADTRGNVIHLGERDCSIQRRHQKVIEEAPSPAVDWPLRRRMGEAACKAAAAIGYVGAGTVEFLLDADGESFYFLEMNTRLQVEHPVTEMITGQDLVTWQVDVAAGKPLPMAQEALVLDGHAIEARLYAEDPYREFLPQSGPVHLWRAPGGPGVRVDAGMATGFEVSPFYDPMIAKIVAHGRDRDEARRRLREALADTVILGPGTNRRFLIDCLDHEVFADGRATTAFIPEHFPAETLTRPVPGEPVWALAAAVLYRLASRPPQPMLRDWASTGSTTRPMRLECDERQVAVHITAAGPDRYRVTPGGESFEVTLEALEDGRVRYGVDGNEAAAAWTVAGDTLYLALPDTDAAFRDVLLEKAAGLDRAGGDGTVRAPMNGSVVAVHVEPGTRVTRGQPLVVLEAMKIEHELTAPLDGVVEAVNVREGDQVATRKVLVEIGDE